MSTIPQIEAADLMLATLRATPFSSEGWIFELKYDGFRALVRKDGLRVDLISRQGNLMNRSFPDVVAAVGKVPGNFIWDAELTVDEPNGESSFERLQTRARTTVPMRVRAAAAEHPARLYVFDILAKGKRDVRKLPLQKRKEILRDSFENSGALVYVIGVPTVGGWVFEQAQKNRFEGMLAKRLDSTYERGRSNAWLKIKDQNYHRAEALGFGRSRPA
jgi:bifunctional non-homologous end joining protein LigD